MRMATISATLIAIIALCGASGLAANRNALPRYDFIPFTGSIGTIAHVSPNGQWITTSNGTVLNAGRVVGKFKKTIYQITDSGMLRLFSAYPDTDLAVPQARNRSDRSEYTWKTITLSRIQIRDINSKGEMVGYLFDADWHISPGIFRIDGSHTIFPYQGYLPVQINSNGDSLWRYSGEGYALGMYIMPKGGMLVPVLKDVVYDYRQQTSFNASCAVAGEGYTSSLKRVYYYWDPERGTKILSTKTRLYPDGVVQDIHLNDSGVLVSEKLNPDTDLMWLNPGRDQSPIDLYDTVSPEIRAKYAFDRTIEFTNQGVLAIWAMDKAKKKGITGLLVPIR